MKKGFASSGGAAAQHCSKDLDIVPIYLRQIAGQNG